MIELHMYRRYQYDNNLCIRRWFSLSECNKYQCINECMKVLCDKVHNDQTCEEHIKHYKSPNFIILLLKSHNILLVWYLCHDIFILCSLMPMSQDLAKVCVLCHMILKMFQCSKEDIYLKCICHNIKMSNYPMLNYFKLKYKFIHISYH